MIIRQFTSKDLDELKWLHNLHFSDDSALPDFPTYLATFVVEDEKGIITFGGLRDIVECVTVTNKDRDPRDRIKALHKILDASILVSHQLGYDQIYVWSKSPQWAKRLQKNGFRPPDGQSLILDL